MASSSSSIPIPIPASVHPKRRISKSIPAAAGSTSIGGGGYAALQPTRKTPKCNYSFFSHTISSKNMPPKFQFDLSKLGILFIGKISPPSNLCFFFFSDSKLSQLLCLSVLCSSPSVLLSFLLQGG
ncbi:hypothetical protein MKX03_024510 [Papaver bracteatum]|nr:hypothetical protein MKX03_024510 [Papaver bracteatum]